MADDRTMRVFWKCGLITTVLSGANADRENPAYIAELYNSYLERQMEKAKQKEMETEEGQEAVE